MGEIDNDPILRAVGEAYAEIDFLHEEVRRKKAAIVDQALSLSRVLDRAHRLSVARSLYWDYRVPAWAISAGLIFDDIDPGADHEALAEAVNKTASQAAMRKMIGPVWAVPCSTDGCDGKLLILSRHGLEEVRRRERGRTRGFRPDYRCPDCERAYRAKQTITFEQWQKIHERRAREAKARSDEFAVLKAKANLSQPELVRLYEIMTALHWEEVQS